MSRIVKIVGFGIATTMTLTLLTTIDPADQRPIARPTVTASTPSKPAPQPTARPTAKRKTAPPRAATTQVKPRASQAPSSRSQERTATTVRGWDHPTLQKIWSRFPAWVKGFGLCVAKHESWDWPAYTGGRETIWQAGNVHGGSSSGAFQIISSTWKAMARRTGIGTGYSRAKHAPAAVQVEVFADNVYNHNAAGAWKGTGCGYGT